MNKFKLLMIICLVVLQNMFPSILQARDLALIAEDLRPLSGYVVMPFQKEFLVDLDAEDDMRVGDLISVVSPGDKIIHPITKEVIGSLDVAKAVLKVTRVKSGYSYARRISGDKEIAKGEKVRRFAGLTAMLIAPPEQGQKLYTQLRELLPDLEWQGHFSTIREAGKNNSPDISFNLAGQELHLLDGEGYQLRSYSIITGNELAPSPPKANEGDSGPIPVSEPLSASAVEFAKRSSSGPGFGKFKNLGNLPGRILMASFVSEKGRLLVATVDGKWVRVFDADDGLRPLGATKIRDGMATPIAVGWWRPEETGPLYLAVTATVVTEDFSGVIEETSLGGAVYQWNGTDLQLTVRQPPYFMESLDLDGDGRPETLMGQEFDLIHEYGRIFVLELNGSKLRRRAPATPLPVRFILPGSTMGDLDGDGRSELVMVHNGILSIFSGDEKVYESSDQMGGSLACFTYDINPGVLDTLFSTVCLDVSPVVTDIDGDGVSELLAISSERSSLKVPGMGAGVKKSRVVAIKYTNGLYEKRPMAIERENPLQGIWEEDGQVYLVESRTVSNLRQKGKSNLLVFPLKQEAQ